MNLYQILTIKNKNYIELYGFLKGFEDKYNFILDKNKLNTVLRLLPDSFSIVIETFYVDKICLILNKGDKIMNKDYLLDGLRVSEKSAFLEATLSESRDTIEHLIDTTLEELRENEIKEAASIEFAINDYSITI